MCTLDMSVSDDIVLDDNHSDSLFIKISLTNAKKPIVGVVCRPTDSDILYSINRKNKDCVLLGDFNIDVSRDEAAKGDFINTLHSSSFFCTINHFTRVTHSTRSTIDNIIKNIQNTRLESGVVLSDITDHVPIVFLDFASKIKLPRQKNKN